MNLSEKESWLMGNVKQRRNDKTAGGQGEGCPYPAALTPASGQRTQVLWGNGSEVLQNWGYLYRLSSCCPLWRVRPCFIPRTPHPPQARLKSFSAKIVQLLKEWTEAFPYDFQDEKAMAELKAITHRVTQCDEVRSSSEPGRVPCLREGWVFRDSSVCGPLCCHSPKRTAGWLHLPLSPMRAAQLASNRPVALGILHTRETLWPEWGDPRPHLLPLFGWVEWGPSERPCPSFLAPSSRLVCSVETGPPERLVLPPAPIAGAWALCAQHFLPS